VEKLEFDSIIRFLKNTASWKFATSWRRGRHHCSGRVNTSL